MILFFISVARGLMDDPFAALIKVRSIGPVPIFLFLAALLNAEPYNWRPVLTAIRRTGLLLCLVVFIRTAFGPETLYFGEYVTVLDINDGARALTSSGALFLGFTLLTYIPAL